jgi:branched-chain amino acid transport system permease protein
MNRWSWRAAPYLAVVLVEGTIFGSENQFLVQLALGITISALLGLSWDILSRTGQVSLGQAAFFGLGSYCVALLGQFGAIAAWLGVVVVCALTAALLGLLTLRLRRVYFSIATLAFTFSLQVLVLITGDWTGGAGGIEPPLMAAGDTRGQLAIVTGLLLVAVAASDLFLTRYFRPAFFMIRSKPDLAAASGVPVVRTKILAFCVSGVLAGLAGAAYASLYGYIVPTDVFTLQWSVTSLAVAILGGMDTTWGPLIGAVLLRGLEEVARFYIGGVGYQVVYGAVIILFVVGMPAGVVGLLIRAKALFMKQPKANRQATPNGEP